VIVYASVEAATLLHF